MDAASLLLQKQFPYVNGLQRTLFVPTMYKNKDTGEFVDTGSHDGSNHWFVSTKKENDSTIYILDSLNSKSIPTNVRIQLA